MIEMIENNSVLIGILIILIIITQIFLILHLAYSFRLLFKFVNYIQKIEKRLKNAI